MSRVKALFFSLAVALWGCSEGRGPSAPVSVVAPSGWEVVDPARGEDAWAKKARDPRSGIVFVLVPSGSFKMGSMEQPGEQPVREIKVKRFYMSETEITLGQWRVFRQRTASSDDAHGGETAEEDASGYPVVDVRWVEAAAFCDRYGYRLPSEAEWEYACRAGDRGPSWPRGTEQGMAAVAWYLQNSGGRTHPAGTKPANPFGLKDMLGSVSEWCADHWHETYDGAPSTAEPWLTETPKPDPWMILRGGSWVSRAKHVRFADRSAMDSSYRDPSIGFRVVYSVE